VTWHIPQLYGRMGDRIAGVEATFELLEETVDDVDEVNALRLMKTQFYVDNLNGDDVDRSALIDKTFAILSTMADTAGDTYARKATAAAAALHFYERHFAAAIDAYRGYLSRWPRSDWAWVAALRIGQAQEALGDWQGAAESYRSAAGDYPTPAPAAVLANTLAARASETLGDFDDALQHYAAAAASFDDDFGPRYSLYRRHTAADDESGGYVSDFVTRADLNERIADLTASSQFPEGVLLESGRRLMTQERWQDARAMLEDLVVNHPTSPLVAEARYLAHRARFERALAIADVASAQSDESSAFEELEALSDEIWDPAVGAARLAVGAIFGKAGLEGRARSTTREALRQWLAGQNAYYERDRPGVPADPALVEDVTAIRNILFRPEGGDFYDNPRGWWNAFDWPQGPPPFFIVDPDLSVKLASGRTTRVRVLEPLPELDNVLFLTDEHLGLLYGILDRLGGTETRPPRAIMETPNQPVGDSVEILALWKQHFPARPGHWGGWVLRTYPTITQIEFHDEERSEATGAVTIGYSGCRVHLEKQDGAWVVVRLSNFWIT
jgi:tetratricopeptide (TPR) repeat protein